MDSGHSKALRQLAALHGVQVAHRDAFGQRREPPQETLLRILRSLGAPLDKLSDAPDALLEGHRALWDEWVPPVLAMTQGQPALLTLHLPALLAHGHAELSIALEDDTGGHRRKRVDYRLSELPVQGRDHIDGKDYLSLQLPLPDDLPIGYHTATLEISERTTETLLLVAPPRAYPDRTAVSEDRLWGIFLPLYALQSERSWGAGDFSDLQRLMEGIASLGGQMVATLPLLASFLDAPFEPSPYSPASRLYWNEFYIDPRQAPEFQHSRVARALVESLPFRDEIAALQESPHVDYRRQMKGKRRVLEALAETFAAEPSTSPRRAAYRNFIQHDPQVEDYARFRAAGENFGGPWATWPDRAQAGTLHPGDYGERDARYHRYVQWLAHEQLTTLSQRGRQLGQGLYLDLPLGAAYDSYDVWRERSLFALDMAAGAPPDSFFTGGQNWGFPPLHPEAIRRQGYRHVIHFLRNHLEYAGVLRIDHVMMLHRLFWIPKGADAGAGAYVRYQADEWYAILKIESHRHRAYIIGENLGTVPEYVNRDLERHNIQRMYVLQYEAQPDKKDPLRPVPSDAAASLNTHDMPPFAAFWSGADIDDREDLGLLDAKEAKEERERREAIKDALTQAFREDGRLRPGEVTENMAIPALRWLAASEAHLVLVNIEDLWREQHPQNVPGTTDEHPNWRRKARFGLEEMLAQPTVRETLQQIDQLRKGE